MKVELSYLCKGLYITDLCCIMWWQNNQARLFFVFYELQKDFVKVMLAINSFLYETLEIHSHPQGGLIMSRIQGDRWYDNVEGF